MKIYTKKGDCGFSRLLGGREVDKTSALLDFYGHLDELNSFLGFAAEALRYTKNLAVFYKQIKRTQQELLDIGGKLSTLIADKSANHAPINNWLQRRIKVMEQEIDERQKQLPKLTKFILPGGNEEAARLHLARSVCRRTERVAWQLYQNPELEFLPDRIPKNILVYLNRLSDWLYMAGLSHSKYLR